MRLNPCGRRRAVASRGERAAQAGARAPLLHTAWAACRAEVHVAHEVLHRWHLCADPCACARARGGPVYGRRCIARPGEVRGGEGRAGRRAPSQRGAAAGRKWQRAAAAAGRRAPHVPPGPSPNPKSRWPARAGRGGAGQGGAGEPAADRRGGAARRRGRGRRRRRRRRRRRAGHAALARLRHGAGAPGPLSCSALTSACGALAGHVRTRAPLAQHARTCGARSSF